jgi:tetratricopeptide (TPR) repeat protein
LSAIDRIQFVCHPCATHRRHYVDADSVKVVLSRLPEELWSRLRKIHFKDDARGNRRLGYVTRRGRREVTLCALPIRVSLNAFVTTGRYSTRTQFLNMFGAMPGSQWPVLAVRRFMLYGTLLHEIGHLQVIVPKSSDPNRKFAHEPKAKEFANHWMTKLYSETFAHPDPVHNKPSTEEVEALKRGWVDAHLEYRQGLGAAEAAEKIAHFKKAVELYPNHSLALTELGRLTWPKPEATERERRETWREAETYLRRAVAIDPACPHAHLYLGIVLSRLEHESESRRFFERSVELDPYRYWSLTEYANSIRDWGYLDEAEPIYRKVLQKRPNSCFALTNYARFMLDKARGVVRADILEAIRLLAKARSIRPNLASTEYLLAVAYHELGRPDEARSHVEEALRLQPQDKHARELLQELNEGSAN